MPTSFWPPSKTNRPARRSPSRTSTSESARKNKVIETPARYFVNGESLTYTLTIENTAIASGKIENGKGRIHRSGRRCHPGIHQGQQR